MAKKLKKDQLVPSPETDPTSKKKKIDKPRSQKSIKEKGEAISKASKTPKKKSKPIKGIQKKEGLATAEKKEPLLVKRPLNYISKQEYEERLRLRRKFDLEIQRMAGQKVQLVSFNIGNDTYAIEIGKIREVVAMPAISKIPHTPEYIKGVANIRGNVMAVIDLEDKFNIKTDSGTKAIHNGYVLVIESERLMAGILVTEVPSTLTINGDEIQSPTEVIVNTALDETFIKGLIKTENQTTIFLDVVELIHGDDVRVVAESVFEAE